MARAVLGWQDYTVPGRPDGVHRGLPSGALTLVVTLDTPLHVIGGGTLDAVVGGLADRATLMTWSTTQHGVQLALNPLACRALFGVPGSELTNEALDLADVWGPDAARVVERLRVAATSEERRTVLAEAIRSRVDDAPEQHRRCSPEVRRAWAVLDRCGGRRRVAELADEVGWSRRHLAARFRDELGLTPQTAGRVLRFDRARSAMRHQPLAEVAATCGYADQAHLTRDFREFAGCPPTTWMTEEGISHPFKTARAGPADDGRTDHRSA